MIYRNISLGIFYIDEADTPTAAMQSDALLLLHGFPTSSLDFSGQFWELLKTRYGRVVTMDYPGYGFSDKPRYPLGMQGADLKLTLKPLVPCGATKQYLMLLMNLSIMTSLIWLNCSCV